MAKLKTPKIKKILQDTGLSQSDFITGNDTIKLVGKAPPRAKIIIYIDGKKVGVAKANKKGVWKFKTDELADGDYNVKVKAKKGKASKKSADKTVVIDTDTDTPVITGVKDDTGTPGDLLTRDTTLTLTGTAEPGARVEISDGAKSLGSVIASAAGMWSFATAVLAQGAHSFSAEATDVAGNARSSSALAVKIDSTPPAAPSKPDLNAESDTGSLDSDNITNDTTPTFSGTAEAGSTVRLYADGLEVGSVVAGGGAWSINASTLADGTYNITARATDAAGNQGPASSALSVTVDMTPPSASITVDPITADNVVNAAEAGGTVAVTGTVGGDIVDGDTVTLTINGNDYTGPVTSGAFTIDVPGGDLAADGDMTVDASVTTTDDGGNPATGLDSQVYTIDTLSPTATIVVSDTALAAGETSLVTITFSEAVTGVDNADLTIENGTLSPVSSSDGGTTWTATLTPTAAITDTTNVITLASSGLADAADNAGTGTTTSNNYAIDTALPTATIVVSDTALAAGETSLVTITFSEAVTGFDNADLTIENGTLSSVGSVDGGITWTATLTPTAAITDTTNVITLANSGLADAADNAGTGTTTSNNYAIDTAMPTATVVVGDTALAAGETSLVTITFSEAVTGFDNADLTIENGTLSPLSSSDGGITWTATLTPTADLTDTTNVITLANTGVTDAAGNAGAGTTNSNNYAIDTALPTATIVVSDTALAAGETSLVTITFSEAVTGFDNADLTIENGTLSPVGSVDGGITWTATLTPTAAITDTTNVITLANTGVTDAADNTGTGTTTSNNYAIDTTGPAPVIDLTTFSPTQGFIIQGDDADDFAGRSVSSAGDVNGDGFDDLIVGANGGADGGSLAGEAYVVFGKASGFGTVNGSGRSVIDLSNVGSSFTAATGFIIQGDELGDQTGLSVSSAGDVNGDGFDDLIVGAFGGDDGGNAAGEAYVVFGKASGFGTVNGSGRSVIDLSNVGSSFTAATGFIIQGDEAADQTGRSVSSAGDVNGDGFDDLIIGALHGDDGGTSAGEAYVVFGKASGFGTLDGTGRSVIDLSNVESSFTAATGFIIQGDEANDYAGFSVSSAGDVNGDGLDDLIIAAQLGDDGGDRAGEAYVVFGKASGFGTVDGTGRSIIDLSNVGSSFTASTGFIVQGDNGGDGAGRSVSSAGDVNGDGFDDLIVGAYLGDDGGPNAGEAYVVFGKASGFGTVDGTGRSVIDLSNVGSSFTAATGFIIQGDAAGDFAGWSVSSAGDVNGDGFDDLIIGARDGDDGGISAGEAYVVFGKASGFGTVDGSGRAMIDLSSFTAATGFIIQGDEADDWAGSSVSSAGDVNGDGFDDLIVGAYFGDDGGSRAGETYIILGGAFGRGDTPVTTIGTAAAEMLIGGLGDDTLTGNGGADVFRGGAGDDVFGVSDLSFADIDGGTGTDTLRLDGAGLSLDLSTTLPAEITSIERIDLTGTGDNTLTVDRLSVFDLTEERSGGKAIVTVTGDAGDIVNVADAGWFYQGSVEDGGAIFDRYTNGNAELRIEYGVTANFIQVIDLTTVSPSQGFIIQGDEAHDFAGWSVSSAGDVNGDGFDDLIVGASRGDGGGALAGEAYVVFGQASGFGMVDGSGRSVIDLSNVGSSFTAATGFIVQGDVGGDRAGLSVSSAGDVNGDGFDDLVVGAYSGDDGGGAAGEAYVVFGKASSFGTVDVTGRSVIDLSNVDSSFTAATGFIIQGDEAGDQTGWSVSSAGDVNGDGFDDLIVGARQGDDGGGQAGEAYVVFGTASGFGTVDSSGRSVIDLSNVGSSFTAATGFVIQGDEAIDRAADSISSAGDVNGDGFDDLIVGARLGDDGGSDAGEAYVVFGTASGFGTVDGTGRSVIDLSNVGSSFTSTTGFVIQGDEAADNAGRSVSSAGDVDGDGFDDIVIGSPIGGNNTGEAYVVFGKASGFGSVDGTGRSVIDLSNVGSSFTAATGFIIKGDEVGDSAGYSVSSAGDVNGDGFDDLIIGARFGDDGGPSAGEAYVVFGKASGFGTVDGTGRSVIDLSNVGSSFTAATGFIIQGDAAGDEAGWSVSSAGDVNGDGFDDIIVGARFGNDGGSLAGEAYVILGGAFGRGDTPVTNAGTSGAEMLIGGLGDDTLSGGGGADVIRSGAGDDALTVGDLTFGKIDGGSGTDTLAFAGAGETIDFTAIADNRIDGIEVLDFTGTGNDTIVMGALDVFHFSDKPNADFTGADSHQNLVILGEAGDTVDFEDFDPDGGGPVSGYAWSLVASDKMLDGSGSGDFDFYNLVRDAKVVASVAVDSDMAVLLDP